MVSYAREEMVSTTDFSRSVSGFVDKIKNHQLEKLAILRNNNVDAVMVDAESYERMKTLEELMEQTAIAMELEKRNQTPEAEYIDHEELLRRLADD